MSTRRFTKAEVPPGGLARSILLHQLFGIINNKTSKIGMACSVQRHQGLQNQTKVTSRTGKGCSIQSHQLVDINVKSTIRNGEVQASPPRPVEDRHQITVILF
jgi:hypothetical protein